MSESKSVAELSQNPCCQIVQLVSCLVLAYICAYWYLHEPYKLGHRHAVDDRMKWLRAQIVMYQNFMIV